MGLKKILALAVLTIGALSMVACATSRVINPPSPEKIQETVRVGDTVKMLLNSGERREYLVKTVDAEAIYGHHEEKTSYTDIAAISIERSSDNPLLGPAVMVGLILLIPVLIVIGLGCLFVPDCKMGA